MPNWCENNLTVVGPPNEVEELWGSVETKDTPLSLELISPTPEGDDWYDWRIKNWGTKWDLYEATRSGDTAYFNTAWAPPVTAITTLSTHWPRLTFCLSYDEPGMNFGGFAVLRDGEVLDQIEGGSRSVTWHEEAGWAIESGGYD